MGTLSSGELKHNALINDTFYIHVRINNELRSNLIHALKEE